MDSLPKKFIEVSTLTKGAPISKGAQGEVIEAKIPNSDSIFALKVYKSRKNRAELQDEIIALTNLEHPNIVRMRGYDRKSILLDLHSNGTLFDLASRKRYITERVAKLYFLELMNALKYMHDKNWVHRDIKLENILISQELSLILADFGFAREENPQIPFTDHRGTQAYNAPEIHRKDPYSGKKVDVFAAGVTLFCLVVKQMPFEKATPDDQFYRELVLNPAGFWRVFQNPELNLSIMFMDLITKMLRFDPSERIDVDQILQHPWLAMNPNPCTQEEAAAYYFSN